MSATSLCLKYCCKDLLKRPFLNLILLTVLSLIGFYAYLNVVLDFYYSWPYATMEAKTLARIDLAFMTDGDEVLSLPEEISEHTYIKEYYVTLEHDGIISDALLRGASRNESAALQDTVFNAQALRNEPANLEGAWVDENLARNLSLNVGDTVVIEQAFSHTETTARISALIPAYADTQGILVKDNQASGMIPSSIDIYDVSERTLEDFLSVGGGLESGLEAEAVLYSKEEACYSAKLLAQQYLPFTQGDTLQVFSVVLSATAFLMYFSIVARRQYTQFFYQLTLVGLRRQYAVRTLMIELVIAAIFFSGVSAVISVQGLHAAYAIPWSFLFYLSTASLVFLGALVGGGVALFSLYSSLRNRSLRS